MDEIELKEYLETHTNFGPLKRMLNSRNPELLASILKSWRFETEPVSFMEVVYQYFNPCDIVCPYGNKLSFEFYRTGYRCRKSCKCTRDRFKLTMLSRYGVEHALQSTEIQTKFKNTLQERYGADNLAVAFSEDIKKTNLEKYGSEYPLQSDVIREKIKHSLGADNPFLLSAVQAKVIDTVYKKYGVRSYLALEENQKKAKAAIIEKYGVETVFSLQSVQDSIKETIRSKYGVEHISQRHIERSKLLEFKDDGSFTAIYNSFDFVKDIMHYFGVKRSSIHKRAKALGLPVKHVKVSQEEQEVYNFLCRYTKVIQSSRSVITPKEIDILLINYNTGIEYNGVYYHSEKFTANTSYHIEKTRCCNDRGITLIHIFSDEWLIKKDAIKSYLLYLMKKQPFTICSESTIIKRVSSNEAEKFIKANSIHNYKQGIYHYGLLYNDELIAVMVLGKSQCGNYNWELLNFSTKLYINVETGARKLFAYFRNEVPGTIVAYNDLRWPDEKLYYNLGFNYSHDTVPEYYYVKSGNKRYPKEIYNNKAVIVSEKDYMSSKGYYRIFDCGRAVWYIK